MQRKPGYPATSCSIKMPSVITQPECAPSNPSEEEGDLQQRRQQLVNFGNAQWGFNNWNWSVTKQDLDFVDYSNGKYSVGVVSYVSISAKVFDIHRDNIGYATAVSSQKGLAIYMARRSAVTNALRETLLSFGGSVATELMELDKVDIINITKPDHFHENNQNLENKPTTSTLEANNNVHNTRKNPPLVATAHPMPARPPLRPPAPVRPNSNDIPPKLLIPIENMSEEEARAERKRRQRVAQEEFRLKQTHKHNPDDADNKELHRNSFDNVLTDVNTQDLIRDNERKRKSPEPNPGTCSKRTTN